MCVCLTSVKKHGTTDKTERRQRGSIKRRKEMEQEVRWRRRRRRPEAGVSPPESHSLPLAPPSAHSSSPLLFCLFSSVYFSSHDSLHMASSSLPRFIKRIIPSSSSSSQPRSYFLLTGGRRYKTLRTRWHKSVAGKHSVQFRNIIKAQKKKKIQEHLAILCPVPLSTVSVITGYL